MQPRTLLFLLVAASTLVAKAPLGGPAHRFEWMLGTLAVGALWTLVVGLRRTEYGRRPGLVAVGLGLAALCLTLGNWGLR